MKIGKYFKTTFHMKSGNKIKFKCSDLSIKKNGAELVGYEAKGISDISLLYTNINEIEAITYKSCFGVRF